MTARGLASSQTSRIRALQNKHNSLSRNIEAAQSCPSTTDFYLKQLKKQKLHLKDAMEELRSATSQTSH